jgi:ribonuclease R
MRNSKNSKIPSKASPKSPQLLSGIIKRHPDGFGFFVPDDPEHPDVYIPKHSMTGVMTNDRVEISVEREPGGDRFRGTISKILARGSTQLVGRIFPLNEKWMQIPDESKAWGIQLKIPVEKSLNAKKGDLVHIVIDHFPAEENEAFLGHVTEIIGRSEDPLTDSKRVLRTLHVPIEFSSQTLKEIEGLFENPTPKDISSSSRKDIQHLPLITIDGATAKDFDDAVYTEVTKTGYRLIVAIADVSHYVRPGTALDKDAYERGTSVYFPNYVVPMLPEILSNGLCSLKPTVPRLCLVADIKFDFSGTPTKSEFYEAVMKSQARVTYGEAQEVIDGTDIEKLGHVKENILKCADLAKILMANRFKQGSLDLDIPQTHFVLDSAGNPIDVQRSERLFSHRLIEELMLAANVATATFLSEKETPAIYRIHEEPSPDNIKTLDRYLHNQGTKHKSSGGKLQKRLTSILQDFSGKPEGHIVNILVLRSLAQAKYSTNNVGHFGLGFEFYTHFTSPIRRYPDLLVHRLLKNQLHLKGYKSVEADSLSTAANMLSACEQRAVKCERQFNSIKKARFMKVHIGREFPGLISSVTKFGVFVMLREFEIDGLIKLENLGDDKWEYDEKNLLLIGKRSKKSFKIGDSIKIRVLNADPELGQVDFELITLKKSIQNSPPKFDSKSPLKSSTETEQEQRRKQIIEEKVKRFHLDPPSSRTEKPDFGKKKNKGQTLSFSKNSSKKKSKKRRR